jgi:platelet-activating factor acetylhydrolase
VARSKAEDGSAIEQMALRRAQLKLREAEMQEALSILSRLSSGDAQPVLSSHLRGNVDALRAARLEEWKDRLDLSDVYALGHSFGGATCVALTSSADTPFAQALTLDPWLEPLLSEGATPPQPRRPLFIINSEYFSIWRSHMGSVRDLVARAPSKEGRKPWLLTLTGTKHTDFSDFPFLIPRLFASNVAPDVCIKAFASASLAQINAGRADAAATATMSEGAASDIKTLLSSAKLDVEVRDEHAEEIQKRDMKEAGMLVVHSLPHAPEQQQGASAAAEAKL